MTLNMRNYKGFNRMPYCGAHCPQAKHTTVADTPEIRRIQENTKIQSTVKYHEEFEKQKGKVTQIADDPETLRIKQNTKIISNVTYHGDLEKKAIMEQRRPPTDDKGPGSLDDDSHDSETILQLQSPPSPSHANHRADVEHLQLSTNQGGLVAHHHPSHPPPPLVVPAPSAACIEELHLAQNATKDSPYSARQASTLIYTSEHGPVTAPQGRAVGSISDYDPLNDKYGSLVATGYKPADGPHAPGHGQQFRADYNNAVHHNAAPQPVISTVNSNSVGKSYRALYDYTAADSDEVTFLDGDVIVNCVPVDDGWMTGTVQRSGQTGMLPANYVEAI